MHLLSETKNDILNIVKQLGRNTQNLDRERGRVAPLLGNNPPACLPLRHFSFRQELNRDKHLQIWGRATVVVAEEEGTFLGVEWCSTKGT